MTIPYCTNNTLGVDFSRVDVVASTTFPGYIDTPPFAVGTKMTGTDGSVWIYVKFATGGVTGLGYVVHIDEDWLATMLANAVGATGDRVGVAPAAALVNNYGWVQVYGTCDAIQVLASAAANVALATTTTAGAIDDAVANPTQNISGMWLTTARAASQGNAPGELNWPTIGSTN
jgi:hypothetical protein